MAAAAAGRVLTDCDTVRKYPVITREIHRGMVCRANGRMERVHRLVVYSVVEGLREVHRHMIYRASTGIERRRWI